MMKPKEAVEMEEALKESLSLGFFEHGTHSDMDLVFYEAYSAVHMLRVILEEFEREIREEAERIMKEVDQKDC